MKRRGWMVAAAIAGAALAHGGRARAASAQETPDDLTVVKRAVAQAPASAPAAPLVKAAPGRRAGQPQWFKVRIVDKGSKKGRVSVNLPLSLVRAFGDAPLDWKCGGADEPSRRCSIKIADVLEALEAGQELVEVDDEDHVVKIWVE